MKKCISALAAILLILAATACTQYQYNWEDFLPGGKPITSEEEFRLFLLDNGSKSARVNVTIDPTSSSYPIEIKGTKKISGRIEIAESRGPVYFSSTVTPPGSVSTRANLLKNLFIVGTGAILESDSLTINVDDSADGLFNSVIEVSGGTIRGEKLNIQISDSSAVIGLYIGEGTAAENVRIENSNPGKINIDEDNDNSEDILNNITEKNPSIHQDDITTRFDAANAEDFVSALANYGRVELKNSFTLTAETLNSMEQLVGNDEEGRTYLFLSNGSYNINLNGNTLTSEVAWYVPEAEEGSPTEVTISNGNLVMNNYPIWDTGEVSIQLYSNTSLILDNANFISNIVGIWLVESNNNMEVVIKNNSSFTSDGHYAIKTTANLPTSENVTITISDSSVTATDGMAILSNVKGNVIIENSNISGVWQAILVRGGQAEILGNSTLHASCDYVGTNPFEENGWSDGNQVPFATLVIGNNSGSYQYPTECYVADSVNITMDGTQSNHYEVYIASSNGNDCAVTAELPTRYEEIIYQKGSYHLRNEETDILYLNGTQITANPN